MPKTHNDFRSAYNAVMREAGLDPAQVFVDFTSVPPGHRFMTAVLYTASMEAVGKLAAAVLNHVVEMDGEQWALYSHNASASGVYRVRLYY